MTPTAGWRSLPFWLGLALPGAGQWARGQWIAGAFVFSSVTWLALLGLADASVATMSGAGMVPDALRALSSGRLGPQAQWALVLAAAVQVWAARQASVAIPIREQTLARVAGESP